MNTTKRLDWIDSLRGLAIVFVLIGHIPNIPDWLFKWIYSFHMPLFFIISGFLYDSKKWNTLGFKDFVIAKAKSYLIPFFILSIVIGLIQITKLYIFSEVIYLEEFITYCFNYFKWILFQVDGDFAGGWIAGLWFLPTLFISSIILFLIAELRLTKKTVYVFSSLIIISIVKYYSYTKIPFHLDVALIGGIYMLCGYSIKKHNFLNKKYNTFTIIILFVISNICIIINSLTDFKKHIFSNLIIMIIAPVLLSFVLLFIAYRSDIKNKLFLLFGKYSILLISLNFIINYLLDKMFTIFDLNIRWFLYATIEISIFFIVSIIYENVLKKIPKLGILIGNRNNH